MASLKIDAHGREIRIFEERGPVMDLGCGAGGASYFWLMSAGWRGGAAWVGVDISEAIEVARDGLGEVRNTHFVQADALQKQLESKNEEFERQMTAAAGALEGSLSAEGNFFWY